MTTYAYVLCFGEYGEGHDPESVHATLEGALAEAGRRFGVRPAHVGGVQWMAKLNQTDEVFVRRFTLRGGPP